MTRVAYRLSELATIMEQAVDDNNDRGRDAQSIRLLASRLRASQTGRLEAVVGRKEEILEEE